MNNYKEKCHLRDRVTHNSSGQRGAPSISEGTETQSPICGLVILILNRTTLSSQNTVTIHIMSCSQSSFEVLQWPQETRGGSLECLWLEGDPGMSSMGVVSVL